MAFALVANTAKETGTTSPIDTTGADLIVAVLASTTIGSLTDSEGNEWACLSLPTAQNSSQACTIRFCFNPKTSASHTFTMGGAFPSLCVLAFSGAVDWLDYSENVNTSSPNVAFSSTTPSQNNALLIAGFCSGTNITVSIDAGFTISNQIGGGAGQRAAAAYLIQTSAGAVAPTWTAAGGTNCGQLITFLLGSSGGSGGETSYVY